MTAIGRWALGGVLRANLHLRAKRFSGALHVVCLELVSALSHLTTLPDGAGPTLQSQSGRTGIKRT